MNQVTVKDLIVRHESERAAGTFFSPADPNAREVLWQSDALSFSLEPGQAFGLLGTNGSGKTSFLKAIGGLIQPASGSVGIPGNTVAILDLNLGFHPDFSGFENLLMMNACYGKKEHEIYDVEKEIAEFANLGDYLHRPVREYSAGMRMRLGMAWALEQRFDLILMDELLSVGDMAFQRQCLARIQKRLSDGSCLILATHNLQEVAILCQEAVALHQGKILAQGSSDQVLGEYLRHSEKAGVFASTMVGRPMNAGEPLLPGAHLGIRILGSRLTDRFGDDLEIIRTQEPFFVELSFEISGESMIQNPLLRIQILRNDGILAGACNNYRSGQWLDLHPGEATIRVHFPSCQLIEGTYYIHASLWPDEFESLVLDHALCHLEIPIEFQVESERRHGTGIVATHAEFRIVGPLDETSS